ncbi:MAG: hypothetical protein H7099_19550 [Gemmatimonadaceae bacterium]|nr:hypothetical protein [Gemmatimonadaceae bacterium]
MTAAPLRFPTATAKHDLTADATALFGAVASALSPQFDSFGRLPTTAETATAAIDEAWPHVRVISFDIFDTLIVRKVAVPRDLFLHLATPSPFRDWGLASGQLAELRQEAENEARRRGVVERGSAEVTLHEIHAVLAERLQRAPTDIPAMVRAERLIERAMCVAHPHMRKLFDAARRDGRTVWCVSDTYHEEAFLRELLVGCGFDLDGVQVVSSADLRMSKGEGRVLTHLAAEARIAPSLVLHIGDHPQSDAAIPASQGFMAICHPWAASRHDDTPAAAPGDAIALGLSQIGSRTVEPAFPYWWRFGYAVAGPLLSGFVMWLHERLVADGVQRAYFLLRDGEIILDVYRAMTGDREGPETRLLESSRRAFMMPALASGRSAITSQLLAAENVRPAREYLDRVGLASRDFAAAFRAVSLDPDESITPGDMAQAGKLLALIGRRDVVQALLQRSQMERGLLMRYLKEQGVLAPGRIALVDIGWNGTIQKAVDAVAALEKQPLDLIGYYLGTLRPITQDLGTTIAKGYLFDEGAPTDRSNTVLQLRQLVEFICTTTRGSLRGFRLDGARVVPVHASVDHPESQRAHVAQLRDGALAFARGLAQEQQVFGAQAISPAAAFRPLARTILHPTAEDAREIGDIHHGDGLGSDRLRALAAYSDEPFTRSSLMRDYNTTYWRQGLLARREPAALALRSLLWMRDG